MSWIVAATIAGGASLGGSVIGALSANSAGKKQAAAAEEAARQQAAASQQAIEEQSRQFELNRGDLLPFMTLGHSGVKTIRDMMGMSQTLPKTRGMIEKELAAQFGKHFGLKPVNGQYQFNPEQQALFQQEVGKVLSQQGARGEMMQDIPFEGPGAMPGDSPLPTFNYPGYGPMSIRDMGSLRPGEDGVMVPAGGPMARESAGMLPPELRPRAADTGSRFGPTIPTFSYEGKPFNFEADPGYQYRLSEGAKAIQNSAAGRTGILSGNTIRALMEQGQGMAASEYDRAYSRWQGEDDRGYGRARDDYLTDIGLEEQAYGRAGDEFNRGLTVAQLMDARNWNRYGQGYSEATDRFNRSVGQRDARFNRIASTVGIGQNATNTGTALGAANASNIGNINMTGARTIGELMTGSANARGAAGIAGANAISGGINNAGNWYQQMQNRNQQQDWLNRAFPRASAPGANYGNAGGSYSGFE